MDSTGSPPPAPPDEGSAAQEPAPPDEGSAAQEPAPPAPAAPSGGTPAEAPSWVSNLTSKAPVVGPAGLVYADLPNRIVAYIIDIILLAIVGLLVGMITSGIGLNVVTFDLENGFQYNYVAALVQAAIGAAISAGYFIYTWTAMRGTLGMKALGMQIGNASDGAALTMDQAVRRWVAVGGWITIAQALNPLPLLGILIGLAALGYVIYLLYTTASSPTKQGFHDVFVGSMVVKAIRTVA